MEEDDVNLDAFTPSWLQTGGIAGVDPAYPPYGEDQGNWNTSAETIDAEPSDDFAPPGECGAPDTGTWIWGAIDGVCQWIDTTTCT